SSLYAAAVDMVPDTGGEKKAPFLGHGYQKAKGREGTLVFFTGQPRHPGSRESLDVGKKRIKGGQKTSILVTKNHDQGVKAVFSKVIQIACPVFFIIEPAFPVSAVHRIYGHGTGMHSRLFADVFYPLPCCPYICASTDLPGDFLQGVKEARVV